MDLADGTQSLQVTRSGADFYQPSWSADGTKLVVVWNRYGDGDLFLMNADGTGRQRIRAAAGQEVYPSLSPDGTRVAYYAYRNGNWGIYVARTDSASGSETSLLFIGSSLPPYGRAPSWHPNGQRLVVTGGVSGNPVLYLVNPDGTNLTPLSFTGLDRAYSASYSPDGTKLVFVGDSAGTTRIYVVPVDTLGARRRVAAGNGCWAPMWSPTGQAIVYRCGNELWVVGASGASPAPTRYRSSFDGQDLSWAPVVRALPVSLPPTGQIVGRAVDAANQTSLSNVRVDYRLSGSGTGFPYSPRYTDGNGNYTLSGLEADTFDLVFSKDGYAGDSILNVVVTGGATTTPRNAQLRKVVGAPGLGLYESFARSQDLIHRDLIELSVERVTSVHAVSWQGSTTKAARLSPSQDLLGSGGGSTTSPSTQHETEAGASRAGGGRNSKSFRIDRKGFLQGNSYRTPASEPGTQQDDPHGSTRNTAERSDGMLPLPHPAP